MNKLKLLLVLLLFFSIKVNAQNHYGIDYFLLENYNLAEQYLEDNKNNNLAEYYFYKGEIAFKKGNTSEAEEFYTKGLTANNNYVLNQIGLAKLQLKTNKKVAEAKLVSIQKENKKEINVFIAMGYAYLDNELQDKALLMVAEARKIDKANPMVYILEGDIYKASNNYGKASAKYEMGVYFNSTFGLSYVKGSQIYETTHPQLAIEKLTNAVNKNPNYKIPYLYLGHIYTTNGKYASAIEAFRNYFATEHYLLNDISRYASALYFGKQYDDAKEIINKGLEQDPNNFVLNRLRMYTAANTNDTENGIKYANSFFALSDNNNKLLTMDYEMYIVILKEAKMYDEAMEQCQKLLAMDNSLIALYKEMASIADLNKQSSKAAMLYHTYMDKNENNAEVTDYYQLGRYYYNTANIRNYNDTLKILELQKDDEFVNKLIQKTEIQKDVLLADNKIFVKEAVNYFLVNADNSFNSIIERVPDGYTGYLWRARTNSLMDPDSELGLSKPFYEKTIDLLVAKGETSNSINKTLIEAYSYLGYYYYIKDDIDNTLLYWNKVLEIDPNNSNANDVINSLKQ